MKLYLIRHGKTEWNMTGQYQGRSDIPLSSDGAAALRRADFSPETVYVSPMRRAIETAAILFPEARQVPVADFREMDFGVFEGRSWREMENDAQYRAWVDSGCRDRCPGGEALEEFSARVCKAFEAVMEKAEGNVVIVAHGGTQMAIMAEYAVPKAEYFSAGTKNGAGLVLDAGHWREDRTLRLAETLSFTTD